MEQGLKIRELINRLARIDALQGWEGDLNPTQSAVLDYLYRANRFSRSPSHVSDYLGTTRGTVSQTLKSLLQKGYVSERKSEKDKRAISFDLTTKGRRIARLPNSVAAAVAELDDNAQSDLQAVLDSLFKGLLKINGGRPFGVCKSCQHFSVKGSAGYCALLSEVLSPEETNQICHEQDARNAH